MSSEFCSAEWMHGHPADGRHFCLLRLPWPRSSMGSARCVWLLTLRSVKIAEMNTWLPRWHQSPCPVAPWVCWYRACLPLKWALIEVASGPFESSGCHSKEEALSLLLPQMMGCPSYFLSFFPLLRHLLQQFLASNNFADKFSPSYWAVAPSFLNRFLWKVVCFNSFDVEGYLR